MFLHFFYTFIFSVQFSRVRFGLVNLFVSLPVLFDQDMGAVLLMAIYLYINLLDIIIITQVPVAFSVRTCCYGILC